MYRIHKGDITMLDGYYIKDNNTDNCNTRRTDYYHVPPAESNLSRASLNFQGDRFWNNTLKNVIAVSASDHLFDKIIKGLRLKTVCNRYGAHESNVFL